jgi:anti-sigma factor RsiW
MKAHDRTVAGIRCTEVLDDLSDYLDGELPVARVRRIEEHLRGCDWCERFGGDFTEVVTSLRARLRVPPRLPADVHNRLMERLHEALGD